jgi:hypothetical protein
MTLSFSAGPLWVYGNITLPATDLTISGGYAGIPSNNPNCFVIAGTCNLTTNGVTGLPIVIGDNFLFAVLNQLDALNANQVWLMENSSWNTGNYNVTSTGGIDAEQGYQSNITVTCGTSTITTSGLSWNISTAGSSISAASASFNFNGGISYSYFRSTFSLGNVVLNSNGQTVGVSSPMIGAFTCNNLTINAPSSGGWVDVNTGFSVGSPAPIVVNGAFTTSGTAGNARIRIGYILGSTLTLNGTKSVSDIDMVLGTVNGTSAPLTGTRLGDFGVAGVTASAPKTVYWNLGGSQTFDAGWAATSGGTPSSDYFPLVQDTAVFDDAGSAGTISGGNMTYTGSITFASRTSAVTFNPTLSLYGSLTLSSAVTKASGTTTFTGPAATSLTVGGAAISAGITVTKTGGGFTFNDALTLTGTTGALAIYSGTGNSHTINLGNFTHNVFSFTWGSSVPVVDFGSSAQINLTGSNATIFTGGQKAYTGTPKIVSTYTGGVGIRTFSGGSANEANALSISTTGSSGVIISSAALDILNVTGSWKDVDFTGFGGLLNPGTRTLYGSLTIGAGLTVGGGTNVTTFAATSGTKTITSNGKTLDFPITFNGVGGAFQPADALTIGSSRALTLTAGTFNLNGFSVTSGSFVTSGASAKTLALGSSNLTLAGSGTVWTGSGSNFTITGTGKVSMTSASAKTFAGGGLIYTGLNLNQGGTGALTFTGSNTFSSLSNTAIGNVLFTTGTTTGFVDSFSLIGAAGTPITLSRSGTGATPVVRKSTAWLMGVNSTNGGNNTGLTFGAGDGTMDYLTVSYIAGSGFGSSSFLMFF